MLAGNFFKTAMSVELRDEIVTHLSKCEECRKVYVEYARAYGKKFDLDEEIKNVLDMYDEEEKITNEKKKGTSYLKAAKGKRISELMGVKSVRDFMINEKDSVEQMGDDLDASGYGWYVIEKMCKDIDLLEKMYKLSAKKEA